MFGTLFRHFHQLHEREDFEVKEAVLKSLEKRWAASDQQVFIAAVLLNPFYRLEPFNKSSSFFSVSSLCVLINGLWRRFYKQEAASELWESYMQYTEGIGPFEMLQHTVIELLRVSERTASFIFK